jgi:hypothetical protein
MYKKQQTHSSHKDQLSGRSIMYKIDTHNNKICQEVFSNFKSIRLK